MAKTSAAEPADLAPSADELGTSQHFDDDLSTSGDAIADTALALPGPDPADRTAATGDDATDGADAGKTVDLRALQEARAETREARKQAAVLEQRWNDFLAGQTAPKPAAQEPVKPAPMPGDDDPVGQLAWLKQREIDRSTGEETRQRETQAQTQERQENERVYGVAQQQFAEASKTDPTVAQAFDAIKRSFGAELSAMGFTGPELQRQYDITEAQYIRYAVSKNIPIGQYVKALAAARGWVPGAAPAPGAGAGGGAAQPDLTKLAESQERHRSLSDVTGGQATAPLDAKALAKMSDKQFKDWMSKRGNEAKFNQIMGQ